MVLVLSANFLLFFFLDGLYLFFLRPFVYFVFFFPSYFCLSLIIIVPLFQPVLSHPNSVFVFLFVLLFPPPSLHPACQYLRLLAFDE